MTIGEDFGHNGGNERLDIDTSRHNATREMQNYFNDLSKRVTGTQSSVESMVRAYNILDSRHFAIEQQVSICFQQLEKGWTSKFKLLKRLVFTC